LFLINRNIDVQLRIVYIDFDFVAFLRIIKSYVYLVYIKFVPQVKLIANKILRS